MDLYSQQLLCIAVMSDDDDVNTMLDCLFKGAVFFFVEPLTMSSLKNLWQFAFTKRNAVIDMTKKESNVHVESQAEIPNAKRKRSEGMDKYEERDSTALKKPRIIWTTELHHRFLRAVRLLGIDGKSLALDIIFVMYTLVANFLFLSFRCSSEENTSAYECSWTEEKKCFKPFAGLFHVIIIYIHYKSLRNYLFFFN